VVSGIDYRSKKTISSRQMNPLSGHITALAHDMPRFFLLSAQFCRLGGAVLCADAFIAKKFPALISHRQSDKIKTARHLNTV